MAEDMPSVSYSSYSRNLEYLIYEVYRRHIEERVKFGILISYMPFMRNITAQIYNIEKNGNKKEAATVFFNHLLEVKEKGKFQSFVNALKQAEYPVLVKALENVEDIANNQDEHVQLINLFFNDIMKTIDPELMSEALQMKEVITSEEGEQIRKTARNSSRADANLELLLTIPHRNENWYKIFLGLLLDHKHNSLVEKIDPKINKMRTEQTDEDAAKDESLLTCDDHMTEQTSDTQPADSAARSSEVEISSSRTIPPSPAALSVPQERTEVSAHEFREILNELADMKSLFHEQTVCLQEVLAKTELIARRVYRLEHKLESVVAVASPISHFAVMRD